MAKEGIPFIAVFAVPALTLLLLGFWIGGAVCLAAAGFMAFFFRDPERHIPPGDESILAPADGRVLSAGPVEPGKAGSPSQVCIFLSPLDVHINRSPIGGTVDSVEHKRGAFHVASKAIASVENEQNVIVLKGKTTTVVVRQIAGILARRLVLWKGAGDEVGRGERIGLMKFGSRMDIIMPAEVVLTVSTGDRVIGGVSVIGRVRVAEPASNERGASGQL